MTLLRFARLFIATAAAIGLSAAVAPAARAASVPARTPSTVHPALAAPDPGVFYEIFAEFISPTSPKCVDVPGASTRAGALLQTFHCKSSTNQLWRFEPVDANGDYQIRNLNSFLCFELPSSSIRIEQAGCAGFTTEFWHMQVIFQTAASPIFGLVNVAFPGMCLAVGNNGSPADGTPLVLKSCNLGTTVFNPGDPAQIWALG